MDSERLKEALLELLNADTEKGQTWFFPSNVSDHYTVILGLNLKQSLKAIGATVLSVLLAVVILRSMAVIALVVYVLIGLITFGGIWTFYVIKPITDRPNISISDFIKQRKAFTKRQKVYYKKPKRRI